MKVGGLLTRLFPPSNGVGRGFSRIEIVVVVVEFLTARSKVPRSDERLDDRKEVRAQSIDLT